MRGGGKLAKHIITYLYRYIYQYCTSCIVRGPLSCVSISLPSQLVVGSTCDLLQVQMTENQDDGELAAVNDDVAFWLDSSNVFHYIIIQLTIATAHCHWNSNTVMLNSTVEQCNALNANRSFCLTTLFLFIVYTYRDFYRSNDYYDKSLRMSLFSGQVRL